MFNAARTPRCALCGTSIPWQEVYAGPGFRCPTCGECIGVGRSYSRTIEAVSLVLAIAAVWWLGVRDELWFVLAVAGLYLPFTWVVLVLISIIRPPTLVPSGHTTIAPRQMIDDKPD